MTTHNLDLDARVAEKVMGWHRAWAEFDEYDDEEVWADDQGYAQRSVSEWSPSSDCNDLAADL